MDSKRIGALALIAGPLLTVVSYLIRPSTLLVSGTDVTDADEAIRAIQANPLGSHLSAFLSPVGPLLTFYGLWSVVGEDRGPGWASALSRVGLILMGLVVVGAWVSAALSHAVERADLHPEHVETAMVSARAAYTANIGLLEMRGPTLVGAALVLSLGIWASGGANKILSWLTAAFSAAALVPIAIIIADPSDINQVRLLLTLPVVSYLLWIIWLVWLGVNRFRSEQA